MKSKPWYSSLPVRLALAAIVLVLIFGWRPFANALGMGTRVNVLCSFQPTSVSCSVAHASGYEAANACWDLVVTCANGTTPTAHACQAVEPGQTATRILPFNSFAPPAENCDQVLSSTVQNIAVMAR